MDCKLVTRIITDVMSELGAGNRQWRVETAMAAPDSEAIQIRILDGSGSGDGSAVVVDLSDKDGKQLSERDKIADRIRQQLATFFKISG